MKNSRLFEILYLLVEKRAVTAGELAQRTARFHREDGDWLEADFTGWDSGAAERETVALVKGLD